MYIYAGTYILDAYTYAHACIIIPLGCLPCRDLADSIVVRIYIYIYKYVCIYIQI